MNSPNRYKETERGVYRRIDPAATERKALVIVFGGLQSILWAAPAVAALNEQWGCETALLTLPQYAAIARLSATGPVYEAPVSAEIPWDWIYAEGFTDVFSPEPEINHEEWALSNLNPIDFMAQKCGVRLSSRRGELIPSAEAMRKANEFLKKYRLTGTPFITASFAGGEGRHWSKSNLRKLAHHSEFRVVLLADKADPKIPGVIQCRNASPDLTAALIASSHFFLGPAFGTSWLAAMTDTPMAVFFDPATYDPRVNGFRGIFRPEKDDIQEWDIYTNPATVVEHIESTLSAFPRKLIAEPACFLTPHIPARPET